MSEINGWISMAERMPSWNDIPFETVKLSSVYYERDGEDIAFAGSIELWEDVDWFLELDEDERAEYHFWKRIKK